MKLNVWALGHVMSAVRLGDCENVQDYAWKIQGYVNDFNLCADSDRPTGGGGMKPKSEHTHYLMKSIRKDDDRWFFTQLM